MEDKAGSRGDSRPESPASDLTQLGVRAPSPTHSVHGCVSPPCSVGGSSQAEGMYEIKFKLEMKRLELEAERERKLGRMGRETEKEK